MFSKKRHKIVSIFKDGYLKKEYINDKYASTEGFPATLAGICVDKRLKAVVNDCKSFFCTDGVSYPERMLRIPEFTHEDIPEGDIIWCCGSGSYKWTKKFWKKPKTPMIHYLSRNSIVPGLIAPDEETAEILRNWHKQK